VEVKKKKRTKEQKLIGILRRVVPREEFHWALMTGRIVRNEGLAAIRWAIPQPFCHG
jgi:hypothetical protein